MQCGINEVGNKSESRTETASPPLPCTASVKQEEKNANVYWFNINRNRRTWRYLGKYCGVHGVHMLAVQGQMEKKWAVEDFHTVEEEINATLYQNGLVR